jgi:hypothetical protein
MSNTENLESSLSWANTWLFLIYTMLAGIYYKLNILVDILLKEAQ